MKEIIIDCEQKPRFIIDLKRVDFNKEKFKFVNPHPDGSLIIMNVSKQVKFRNGQLGITVKKYA